MLSPDALKILQAIMSVEVRRRHDGDTSEYNDGVDAAVAAYRRAAQLAAGMGAQAQMAAARAMPHVDSQEKQGLSAIDRLRIRQAMRRM